MGYSFVIKKENAFKVKKEGLYPWPCKGDPGRTIHLYTNDVFTRDADGTYMKQTGLGCFGIVLKAEEVEQYAEDVPLRML